MTTRQRTDLVSNIPALKKLDVMLTVSPTIYLEYASLHLHQQDLRLLFCRIVLINSRIRMSSITSQPILLNI